MHKILSAWLCKELCTAEFNSTPRPALCYLNALLYLTFESGDVCEVQVRGKAGVEGCVLAGMLHNDLGSRSAASDPRWQVLHCKAGMATASGTGWDQRQPETGLASHRSQLTIGWQAPGWHLFGIRLRKVMATQSLAVSPDNSQRQTGLRGLAFLTRAIHLFCLHAVYYLWCISRSPSSGHLILSKRFPIALGQWPQWAVKDHRFGPSCKYSPQTVRSIFQAILHLNGYTIECHWLFKQESIPSNRIDHLHSGHLGGWATNSQTKQKQR